MAQRAPKQWSLSKHETLTSFENWRQNIQYTLSLDANFATFLLDQSEWKKKTNSTPLRGLSDDDENVPAASRRTATQKVTHLDLMLGQIANFCPVISRNTIVKNSVSIKSIWQAIRLHFGFQSSGAHFLDFAEIKLEADESHEDLFQRLMAFVEDNLLAVGGGISHHLELPSSNEDISPSLENMIVLQWLKLIHPELPRLVKQRYGTELRSRTLASLKPEISQALTSLLDELTAISEIKVMRQSTTNQRSGSSQSRRYQRSASNPTTRRAKQCPLCKQAGRASYEHYLSECRFLPENDRLYLSKARNIIGVDCDDGSDDEQSAGDGDCTGDVSTVACRVNTKQSPFFKSFYRHHPLRLTLDTGAETNMIREAVAKSIGAKIGKSSQLARQADGVTPLNVIGETHLTLSRDGTDLQLDALVVADLDVDVLAGTPFMSTNDVSVRPARHEITIGETTVIQYGFQTSGNEQYHTVRRAHAYVLHAPSPSTTVWPGEFVELQLPTALDDQTLAVEPRSSPHNEGWPKPGIIEAVGNKIRLVNTLPRPLKLSRHEHFCQVRHTVASPTCDTESEPAVKTRNIAHTTDLFSEAIELDCDKQLPESMRGQFRSLHQQHDSVFNPSIVGYNGHAGPFTAVVNMGPVLPPQRKGRCPQYAREKLTELQEKFDELEAVGVFQRPEDAGISVEYLNPSFLVRKPNGGSRLVTAFSDVGRYSKPQPSLMPDVDSTLRQIACWKYIVVSDLTSAFYQIPLAKESMKFCGVATPFRGVRVYTRCAMGMPGSETALEELMCRVLGDLLQDGVVAKLADDLYCGGNSPEELLDNWGRVLDALDLCDLRLSAKKTRVFPTSTTILGWVWSQGTIRASPHRITTLSSCVPPQTVLGLRSFVGAFKVLGRVIPQSSKVLAPLESHIAGKKSQEPISWSENLHEAFCTAQKALSTNRSITLPRPDDQLWIVTDGSVTQRGIGATLYVSRNGQTLLAGFFSAKLKKHQVTWLPCEIEALGIAAAVKHFSPYIIQSKSKPCLLTDSKPCVQAIDKLCRGEFSSSPRVTSFLTIVSRYQVTLRHLSGAANVPSDFASRNAPECMEPRCQICAFISRIEESVVGSISVEDIVSGSARLPFTSRSAWLSTQAECPDLRRVRAHLKQGTRPSKKLTNIKDVKRYLTTSTLARDGVVVVRQDVPFAPSRELIVVPRQVLDGLLTAIHLKLSHPSKNQLKVVVRRSFFALDLDSTIERVTDMCHVCASLKKVPTTLTEQTSTDAPDAVGISFAADVIKRNRQLIFVVRETVTSYTSTCVIENERHDALRDSLARLCMELRPIDGPSAVVRVDPAPGFIALVDDPTLQRLGISIEIGRIKNANKNPVAEKAVAEVEDEILRQEPGGGTVSPLLLAVATSRLNSRIRSRGLSAREMWFQRDQFTNAQLPIADRILITEQQQSRERNHPHSELAKAPRGREASTHTIHVGDLVYITSDRNKSSARDRYLVTSVEDRWCFIRKFSGHQLRASSYKVKLSECYLVPNSRPTTVAPPPHHDTGSDIESDEDAPVVSFDEAPQTPLTIATPLEVPVLPTPTDEVVAEIDTPADTPRPVRRRVKPKYLQDYVTS